MGYWSMSADEAAVMAAGRVAQANQMALALLGDRIRLDPVLRTTFLGQGTKVSNPAITDVAAGKITGTLGNAQLGTDSVDALQIKAGAVGNPELGAAAVDHVKLAADAVETDIIKDANVTAAKLAADSVITAKILDANVTDAKVATGLSAAKLTGTATIGVKVNSDPGGTALMTTLTNAENTAVARDVGVGRILFADAVSRDCIGFAKVYLGTTPGYIAVFASN